MRLTNLPFSLPLLLRRDVGGRRMRSEGKEKKISKESGSKTDKGKGGKKGGERRKEVRKDRRGRG